MKKKSKFDFKKMLQYLFESIAYSKIYKFEKKNHFITIDMFQKYTYPKLGMFLNLGVNLVNVSLT